MNFRSKHWSAIAVMAAVLLAVAGLTTSASAAITRTLTISASPAYEYAGKPITFAGSVTKSPKGTVVKIQRKSGATWVAAGQTTTTTAGGAYSVKLNAPGTPGAYTYRGFAPKTRTLAGTYSNRTVSVTVLRKTTATLTINPTSILTGQSANFTGSVSPFTVGKTVTIQRQSGSSWVSVGTATLSGTGTYTQNVTPSGPGVFTYRVMSPLNGLNAGTTSPTKTLAVSDPDAPVITTTSLPDGDQALPYTTTLTKTGDAGTWSIPPATLPGGLSLNGTTGVLSGTPTGSGTRNLSITFTATGSGLSANKVLPITINPGPAITTTSLPEATQGVAYSTTLTKTGRPGTWSIQGLPAGLSINADTGVISGTTNAAVGDYGVYPTFTETVGGRSVLKAFALHVKAGQVTPPTGPTITTTTLPDGDQGLPYSATLTKTGGAGTWAIAPGPGLKPGLTLNSSTGVISGTPAGNSTSNFTVTFTETSSGLVATKALSMYITPYPTITTATLPDATQNTPYTAPLAKTGKAGTWSIQGLPAGLSINADTGVISGTTSAAAGDYGVYPTFTETVGGRSVLKPLALHVNVGPGNPPNGPTITTTTLPDGDQGLPYSATLTKTGGAGTWAIAPGPGLKPGLTLNPDTGVISGTPTGNSTSNFTVTFTETSSGLVATKALSMYITPYPTITTTSLPDATRGAAYSTTLAKSGKAGTWSIQGLPAGLSINAETGEISGTTNAAVGDYGVYPTFTETSTGRSVLKAFALHIGGVPLAITTDAFLPDGHKNAPYSVTFTKTGGAGTWSSTQIPDGFSLDATTGTLTGTPTVAGTYAVYITFTETVGGGAVTKIFSLKVIQPKITTTSIPDGVTGTPYSVQLAKTGLDGTWEVAGFLPDAFTFSPSGLLSGTPTETGDFQLLVKFTETSTGVSSQQFYILHVAAPGSPTITTTSLPNGTIGTPYSATLAATPTGGTWTITEGSLPVGLSLNASTGAITGTPIVAEDARFVVTYTNGATKNTKYLRLLVPPAP